jgi:predicted alpha/beta superfamily hydrolase
MITPTRTSTWEPYPGDAPGEHTVVGTILVRRAVAGPGRSVSRDLYVYLPPSYGEGDRRYPVLYMHDGQNLFDQATSFGSEWEADETLEEASHEGLECIVVGIPNTGDGRIHEYSPWRDSRHRAGGGGEAYVDWIVGSVKPMIDADFRTRPDRASTGIAGSSMGGLISLYAFFRRPEVFGFVGAMSPAFWFADRRIYRFVTDAPHVPGRIYMDAGTGEGREVLEDLRRMKEILLAKSYRLGKDLLCLVEMGGRHEERAWGRRLRREMYFLLDVPDPRITRR